MKDKFVPILVEWEDTAVTGGWQEQEDVLTHLGIPYIVYTVGFLVAWNKERIILVMGYTPACIAYQEIISIPKGMIRSITYLKRSKGVPGKIGRIEKPRNSKN